MKKTKKALIFSALIAILAAFFAVSASASDVIADGYYKYKELDSGTVEITDYTGSEDEIIIPEEFNGKKVTVIGEGAFSGASATEIVLPSGTELIDWSAFESCTKLESVTFNESLKVIESFAFYNCRALKEISLPEGLEKISWGAFDDAAEDLIEITIPGSIKACDTDEIFESGEPNTDYGVQKLLVKIAFGEGAEDIEFTNKACPSLKYVYAPASVQKLEVGYLSADNCFEAIIYAGTSEQWDDVELGKNLRKLIDDNKISIHIASEHSVAQKDATASSCGVDGYTAGEYCEVCDAWISGHEVIPFENEHDYRNISDGDSKAATFTENGYVTEKCIYCEDVRTRTVSAVGSVSLSTTNYVYNGKNKTPKVTVKDVEGNVLVKNRDYKLIVASSRSGIGRWTVKVTLTGDYSGTKKVFFYIKPGKPAIVKSASQTASSVKLSWSAVPGAEGYTVYRYSPSKKAYVKAGTTEGTSLTVKNLYAGTKYTCRVVAYGETSAGKVYNSDSYALLKTATKTKTPTLTKVTASSTKGKAYVYHSDVSGETGYTVYYSTKKDSGFKKYANFKSDTTRCDITGLTSGKTYYFKVRTYIKTDSGYVYSAWSSIKSVKVK